MPLPEGRLKPAIVTLTCSDCGSSKIGTLNLPFDVPPPKQALYHCRNCTPKVETLSKGDDFQKQLEAKWEATGGEIAHKRVLQLARTKRWRERNPEKYEASKASQREKMRRKRAA